MFEPNSKLNVMTDNPLRILLIEDHLPLRRALADLFNAHGFETDFAADGRTGLKLALADPPDVLVLDVGLPGMDGLKLCQRLRAESDRHVPVLMLTARDTLKDKLSGFAVGADDYLIKPFANDELVARCVALSQRHRVGTTHELRVGPLRIDRRTAAVYRDDQPLSLQGMPYRILLSLAEAWPRAVTRTALIRELWPDETPPSDPLRSHLYLLRLEMDKPFEKPLLKTVHGVGFKLNV